VCNGNSRDQCSRGGGQDLVAVAEHEQQVGLVARKSGGNAGDGKAERIRNAGRAVVADCDVDALIDSEAFRRDRFERRLLAFRQMLSGDDQADLEGRVVAQGRQRHGQQPPVGAPSGHGGDP